MPILSDDPNDLTFCPACGYKMDSAEALDDATAKPDAGDVSLCLKCGERLVYVDNLHVRALTQAEYDALPDDTKRQMDTLQKAILTVNITPRFMSRPSVLQPMQQARARRN